MTKRRRTLEKPAGRGHIWLGNDTGIKVHYSLVVLQTVDDEVDTSPLAAQVEIRGAIEVEQDQSVADLKGAHFRLELNDGRCLEAWAEKGDIISRQWEIVAASSEGLKPCEDRRLSGLS
jgi:hypothetical protein